MSKVSLLIHKKVKLFLSDIGLFFAARENVHNKFKNILELEPELEQELESELKPKPEHKVIK